MDVESMISRPIHGILPSSSTLVELDEIVTTASFVRTLMERMCCLYLMEVVDANVSTILRMSMPIGQLTQCLLKLELGLLSCPAFMLMNVGCRKIIVTSFNSMRTTRRISSSMTYLIWQILLRSLFSSIRSRDRGMPCPIMVKLGEITCMPPIMRRGFECLTSRTHTCRSRSEKWRHIETLMVTEITIMELSIPMKEPGTIIHFSQAGIFL
mmetsp:Transcript_19648/g.36122  ORF Transcript_19648/g.36122 Transcript_19648/m.36122 type:complete len:211 (+) Transcript_19648:437-1069(+)